MKRLLWVWKDCQGSFTVATVILMFVFVGILAFVLDLAHVKTVKTELSNAAEAAALAGTRALMPLDVEGAGPWPMEDPPPCATAIQAALDTSVVNFIDQGPQQKDITLVPSEVTTGFWDYIPAGTKAGTFTPSGCASDTNAVRVTARMRGDLPQGSVQMGLATIFGVDAVNPAATAIAALGYLQTLPRNSDGGFLAMDHDYLERAWERTGFGKDTSLKFYLVFGPALGQTSYEFADNGSWALPSDIDQPFNPTISDYIANGTSTDNSLTESVDLKNGEMTNLMKNLQDAIANKGGAFQCAVYGVYAGQGVGMVGDAWNEKNTQVDSYWTVTLTEAWTASEFKKDPDIQTIVGQMFPDLNDQKNIVGLIEFTITGKAAYGGEGGAGLPSNTYGIMVKLVDNDSLPSSY